MDAHKKKILSFYRTHHRMPTYAEMLKLFSYKTKSAVAYAVQKLVASGVLSKDTKGRLTPRQLVDEIALLGYVEAGFPTAAEEELIDTMNLDEYLIRNREATFMLKVKGDSMIDAGIMEGDMVLVERGKIPKPGDIVIACVDGSYTMKYLRQRNNRTYLEPANAKYKPIYPENEMQIEAVVQAVIRQY